MFGASTGKTVIQAATDILHRKSEESHRSGEIFYPIVGPPGILGIWGDWLFIFRELGLGSTGNIFKDLGCKLIVLGLREHCEKVKKISP